MIPKKSMIGTRRIEQLKPHPRQGENFLPMSDAELSELKKIMKTGVYDPIEITPDDDVIDGHQRLRAAIEMGWTEIRVKVRHDLAGDEVAIEIRHLQANAIRRQLHSLDRARCARRMLELKNQREPGKLTDAEEGKLARDVAKLIGKSHKHALRLIRITNLPMEIQAAVKTGELNIVEAEPIAKLDREVQEEIAEEIRDGGQPKAVVTQFLPQTPVEVDPNRSFGRLIASVERELDELEGREGAIKCPFPDPTIATLERIVGFSRRMIPLLRAQKAKTTKFKFRRF
jgi:ParB/RepB/Spo0J family partition protein